MIFSQKNFQTNIRHLLKNYIQKVLLTAEDSVGEFATCFQTWLGNDSSFFCSHYLAKSKEDVEKQVQSWGTDKYASFFVVEVDRFTSGLKPKHEKIKLSSWYKAN